MSKTEKHIEYYPFPILNGQKRIEGTYKDGELISEKCWN